MAAKLEEAPATFDATGIIRIDIDIGVGQGFIGLFTADLTASLNVTMGHIRSEIGKALGLSQEDFTIKHAKTVVPDDNIAKVYFDEIKDQNDLPMLCLDMDNEKQKFVALALQKQIKENKDILNIGRSIVMEQICEDKNITLTIFKPCFNLYVDKYL